jgi:IS605 OrfB family transposase
MMADKQQRTYQARISPIAEEDNLLGAYAGLFSKAQRTLFAKLQAGADVAPLKRQFLPKFGITARQFNAMSAELKGKISSIKERRTGLIKESEQRISRAKKVLKEIANPEKRHNKKRRIETLQSRLAIMKADHKAGKVRLCFGSKKLFNAQFHLEDNGYADHAAWLADWQDTRKSQFFVLGSKDETSGCQSCVATVADNGSITLRLRLPDVLSGCGKYLAFNCIRFEHGHEAIVAAIGRNLSNNKDEWQAIGYRFLRDGKGWRVFVTIAVPQVKRISDSRLGVVAVDINSDHLAVTETDRFGNPVEALTIPCVTYGKSKGQRGAVIGDAVKQVMSFVFDCKKPIVIEKLDFQKKKSALESQSAKYARMLSALSYSQIQTTIRARAFDGGIEVLEVNPAYTSVIGQYKFKDRYGLSAHNAAALVIGRRSLGFSETLPSQVHATLPLSARNRSRHVWTKWAVVSRKTSAALAALRQSQKGSSPSPGCSTEQGTACDTSAWTGEIPVCESSQELFV